jgi:ribosome-associated protein
VANSNPSKSAKKRVFLELQELGEQLLRLTEEQLRSMDLDENLFDAVIAAAKMKSHGALRRQRQLIGKLMRNVDPEPIRRALDVFQHQERTAKDVFRRAEEWRDRIVQSGHPGLNEFFDMTGREYRDLSILLNEYAAADDSGRRTLRRKIFRLVHAELTTMVQNCAV